MGVWESLRKEVGPFRRSGVGTGAKGADIRGTLGDRKGGGLVAPAMGCSSNGILIIGAKPAP